MEGWKTDKLKNYISVESGYAFKTEDFSTTGIPVVKIGNIVDNTTKPTNGDSYIRKEELSLYENYIIREGDVLIAMSGNTTCKMGRVSKAFSPSLVNQRVGWIKPLNSEINIDFVYYLLQSESYQNKLWNYATATGQPNLSPRDICKINFYKPTLPEQSAIAAILSKVDESIATVQASITAAERLKKSLMQNLLTGRMKPDGTMRTEDEFYLDEKFGKVPKGWVVKKVGDVFDTYPTASYSRSKLLETGTCKYIHYGDIHTKFDTFLDISNTELPYISDDMIKNFVFLKDGDIIIADTSEDYEGVGKLVEIKNIGNDKVISGLHTLHIRSKSDELINGYKGYMFNEERVMLSLLKYVTGIKVYSISKSCLARVLIPIPTKEEQKQIKSKLDSVNSIILQKKEEINTLERLKKSLMQNLLTGRVRIK